MDTSPKYIESFKKTFKIALAEKGLKVRELAKILGLTESYLGQCINYVRFSERTDEIRLQACNYLGIDPEKILEEVRENDG
jgi:DNA-binding Xre family transcriptional regulator